MPIESAEEAQEYLEQVTILLKGLVKISENAGMYSHAGIWCIIIAAFWESTDEVQTIVDIFRMYVDAKFNIENGRIAV